MRKAAFLLVGCALLSACSMAPKYVQPTPPVAPTFYPQAGSATATAPVATDLAWRDFFTDPRLQALVALALDRNRDLAVSYAKIEQARAQFRITGTQRLPNVEVNGSATRTQQPLGVAAAPIGGGLPPGAPDAIRINQYQAQAGVSAFELDLWGRVRNMAEADRQSFLASVEGARAFRLSLISQVAAAYFDIRAGEQRLDLADKTIANRKEGAHIAQRRLDAGVTSTVDYDQTVLLLTQAQAEAADIQRQTEQSRNLLDVLIGGPAPATLPTGLSLAEQVRPISADLPSALLTNRPDILQAEHQLRAANADIGAARAAFFPSISLTGNFGFVSTALGDLFKDRSQAWSFGGALNLPIFDWGKRSAQLRLSKAKADEMVATYQKAAQGAFQEVNDALVGRRRFAEQIDALTRTVETQQRLANTARRRYDNGISEYLQVLDAERSLFSAAQELVQLRATELQNDVGLYVALGGDTRFTTADQIEQRARDQAKAADKAR